MKDTINKLDDIIKDNIARIIRERNFEEAELMKMI